MPIATIPNWNAQGVLPPHDPVDPISAQRSPYIVRLTDFVLHFGTTEKRLTILHGLLDFRAALHAAELDSGFQWVNGSFLEDIETVEKRAPADIDVVTFFHLPPGQTQQSFASAHPNLFKHAETKNQFHVDAYFVPLDDNPPACLVERSAYWYSLWSHRRNGQWKGYLQIDLSATNDGTARAELQKATGEGTAQ